MNSTKEQKEKLQHSTGGSLVAGIIADINQEEQQQVNAGLDGVKVPAKTDPTPFLNFSFPEMINLKTIPFTDMDMKPIDASAMTPTAYDQTLEAEAKRRVACAALAKTGIRLMYWGRRILAYKLGVSFYTDHRRTKVSQVLVEGLSAIAPLFEVDRHLKYKRFVDLFDAYGWRITSVYDLRQLGRGRSHDSRPFSKREVRFILDELEFTGFLEHKEILDSVKRRKQLFIRFRPDRIQQAIKAVSFLSKAELEHQEIASAVDVVQVEPVVSDQQGAQTENKPTVAI